MILVGNVISAIGAFLLFAGYFEITVRNKEKSGVILSGLGSFVMCFAFYILDSMAFLTLNIIWTMISIHGYLNRNTEDKENKEVHKYDFLNPLIVLCLVFPGAYFVYANLPDVVSWISIGVMLISYFAFAWKKMSRIDYIKFSIAANALCLFHMVDIQNYSSVIQTIVSVAISFYAILKENKTNKEVIEKEAEITETDSYLGSLKLDKYP